MGVVVVLSQSIKKEILILIIHLSVVFYILTRSRCFGGSGGAGVSSPMAESGELTEFLDPGSDVVIGRRVSSELTDISDNLLEPFVHEFLCSA